MNSLAKYMQAILCPKGMGVSMKKYSIVLFCFLVMFGLGGCRAKDYIMPTDQSNEQPKVEEKDRLVTNELNTKEQLAEEVINESILISPLPQSFLATEPSVYPEEEKSFEDTLEKAATLNNLKAYVNEKDALEIIITGDSKDKLRVNDSLNLITSVEKLYWLDQNRLVIIAHINPSLQCFMVYDLKTKQLENEKYGIGFTWKDNDISTLIYIVPKPHFSKNGNLEMIKDYQDKILYQAPKGMTISNLKWEQGNQIKFILIGKSGNAKEKVIEPNKQ